MTLLLVWYALFWFTLALACYDGHRPTPRELLNHLVFFPTLPLWLVGNRMGWVFGDA